MDHHYWVLRYVPNTIRGEFVNVGVIVGGGENWALRITHDWRRANRLGGEARRARDWLESFQDAVDLSRPRDTLTAVRAMTERSPLSFAYLERMRLRHNNAVQLSVPQRVAAQDMEIAADLLFSALVSSSTPEVQHRPRTQIVRALKSEFEELAEHVDSFRYSTRRKAKVGRQSESFDFAIGSSRVQQLTQVWSFDVQDQDALIRGIRSWSMVVNLIREDGAVLTKDKGKCAVNVAPNVPVRVVYGEPTTSQQRDTLDDARELWSSVDVHAYPSQQMERVVDEAHQLALTS